MSDRTKGIIADGFRKVGGLRLLSVSLMTALMAVVAITAPGPLADHSIEGDIRTAAEPWKDRVLAELSNGAGTFSSTRLTQADREFLDFFPQAAELHRLSLIDAEGHIFWSSEPGLIGTQHSMLRSAGPAESDHGHFQIEFVTRADHGGEEPTVVDGGSSALRAMATLDLPLTINGVLAGSVEIHGDVTLVRGAKVRQLRLVMAAGVVAALLTMLGMRALLRAGRERRREAEARAQHLKSVMAEQLRLTREVRLLGQINEWLQSSRSIDELFPMVARFMEHVLPGSSGSLYVQSNSRDVLDGAASWNGGAHLDHIRPEDCWGLRRGRTYAYDESEVECTCAHVKPRAASPYLCIPIVAHGETVGLMTLTAQAGATAEDLETQRRIAQMSAEQISLAVANVRMRDALHQQTVRDPLTGLFNRRHLLESFRRLVDSRSVEEVGALAIAVDHLKRLNDSHGHDAGDLVLRQVGEVLRRHAKGEAIACRTGGEKLMLLLPGIGEEEAARRAERLRHDVADLSIRHGDMTLPRITVSVGVAEHPRHGARPAEVIRAADDALDLAKAQGGDRVALAGAEPAGVAQPPESPAWKVYEMAEDSAEPTVYATFRRA